MRSVVLLVVLLVGLAVLLPTADAATYTILIGWQSLVDSRGPSWYSLFFWPSNLTIAYGDSVTWLWNSLEEHNVVFSNGTILDETNPDDTLAPIAGIVGNQTVFTDYGLLFSSGIRNSHVAPLTLQFLPIASQLGVPLTFYCSIHQPEMTGTLTVLPPGSAAPFTPEEVEATVNATIAQLEQDAITEIANMQASGPKTGPQVPHIVLSDGSTQWTVVSGAMWMDPGYAMYPRFIPSYIEIHEGDTIEWIVTGSDPHYVFFNASGVFNSLFTNWSPDQTEPVNASISIVDPGYSLQPSFVDGIPVTTLPTAVYPNTAGVVNSGLIFASALAGLVPFPTNFSTQFVATGSFPYTCPIHYDIGMTAEVVVKPAGSPLCTNASDPSTCALVSPVSVKGDPQFTGLLGQSYQVHGIDGAVYNIITQKDVQVNAKFAFLTGPRTCPSLLHSWTEDEKPQAISCWSHDGSYLSELGLFTPRSRLYIRAGATTQGFTAVDLDNIAVKIGQGDDGMKTAAAAAAAAAGDITVRLLSRHHLIARIGAWTLHVENSDGFVNIARLSVSTPYHELTSHGLLGQTWRRPARGGKSFAIQGDVDDYSLSEGHVFGIDFLYNQFGQ